MRLPKVVPKRRGRLFAGSIFRMALATGLVGSLYAAQQISQDRDLKELDLASWPCLNRPDGSAKTPDGAERNRLKNRSAPANYSASELKNLDSAGFLKNLADWEATMKGKRRKDLTFPEKQKLAPLEQQMVKLTGYLVLAYCGPPETTNCASTDFHDWHLEIFEKPLDHHPGPGDPTPIVCEITPRTQNAIYHDNIRIQELAAFFRHPAPDMTYEPTGHPARKIRLTGYLLWDDEHNGANDVGTTVRAVQPNKYHIPWRLAAWEIHPVFKIEVLPEGGANVPAPSATAGKESVTSPAPAGSTPPNAPSVVPSVNQIPTPAPTAIPTATPQFVTITQPVKIRIPYGETVLPRGARLPIESRTGQTVIVKYMGGSYPVPISSTDLPQ